MKLTKKQMIKKILRQVEDWDLETLINYAQDMMNERIKNYTLEEIKQEYKFYKED